MLTALRSDLAEGFMLLTRLPVGWLAPSGVERAPGRAVWSYPVVGAVLGALAGLVMVLALASGVPRMVAALLAVAAGAVMTGGLHEDGLADTADGIGGGRDVARRLEIMRDSRIGSYGALALVLSVALRAASLAAAASPFVALVVAGACGRAAMLAVLRLIPPARREGLAAALGDVPPRAVTAGMAVAVAVALGGWIAPLQVLGAAAGAALAVALVARRYLGGYTGDVLGAAAQVADISVLVVMAAQ